MTRKATLYQSSMTDWLGPGGLLIRWSRAQSGPDMRSATGTRMPVSGLFSWFEGRDSGDGEGF